MTTSINIDDGSINIDDEVANTADFLATIDGRGHRSRLARP
jgi:hypothetical protein